MSTDTLEPQSLIEATGQLFGELGPVATYNRVYRAGIHHGLLVRSGRVWCVPPANKAALRAAVLALPHRPARAG